MSDTTQRELPREAFEAAGLEWDADGTALLIRWNDGHESRYSTQYLRRICPCANCRGAHAAPPLSAAPKPRFQVLSDMQAAVVRNEVSVARAYPVGNYAIGFHWSDGHDLGIYSYRYLRQMCPSETNADRLAPRP